MIDISHRFFKLTKEEIENLPIEEFDGLAKEQSAIFPDLLKITSEEEIVATFYRAYNRCAKSEDQPPSKLIVEGGIAKLKCELCLRDYEIVKI